MLRFRVNSEGKCTQAHTRMHVHLLTHARWFLRDREVTERRCLLSVFHGKALRSRCISSKLNRIRIQQ